MVRLGQENEKYSQRVQNMQASFEAKIGQLESRLSGSEQSTTLFDKKSETTANILSELLEKVESRVLTLD